MIFKCYFDSSSSQVGAYHLSPLEMEIVDEVKSEVLEFIRVGDTKCDQTSEFPC